MIQIISIIYTLEIIPQDDYLNLPIYTSKRNLKQDQTPYGKPEEEHLTMIKQVINIWTTYHIQIKEKQREGSFNGTDIRLITTQKKNIKHARKITWKVKDITRNLIKGNRKKKTASNSNCNLSKRNQNTKN